MSTDLLANIGENQLHPSVLNKVCHSINIGVAELELCINGDPLEVGATLSILGVTVANCILSEAHKTCKIGGGYGGFKAEVDLTLDTTKKTISFVFIFCAPFIGCKTYTSTIPY